MKLSNILSRRNRILLRELVVTDFKLRYQGSVLGYLWSLLKPLMLFAIMLVVFAHFLRFGEGVEHFAVTLLLGIVLWTFFTEATGQGMQAIVARGDLLRKIKFPKYILVISGTISALINLVLNLLVVFVFMLIDGVDFGWVALLFPLNILLLYVFSLALAFFLSAAFVKFRDIAPIWEVVMQGLFYATPIIYPLQMVVSISVAGAQALMLSPISVIIQDSRANLVGHEHVITQLEIVKNPLIASIPYVIIAITVIFASWYFKRNQKTFVENV